MNMVVCVECTLMIDLINILCCKGIIDFINVTSLFTFSLLIHRN